MLSANILSKDAYSNKKTEATDLVGTGPALRLIKSNTGHNAQRVRSSSMAAAFLLVYLEEARFTIQTDYDAFRCIPTVTRATGKQTNRSLKLSNISLTIVHRASIKYKAAEKISCCYGSSTKVGRRPH